MFSEQEPARGNTRNHEERGLGVEEAWVADVHGEAPGGAGGRSGAGSRGRPGSVAQAAFAHVSRQRLSVSACGLTRRSLPLLVLRLAGTQKLAQRLPRWGELFAQVYDAGQGLQTLYRVVRYIHYLGDERASAAVKSVLHSIMESKQAEAFMRTMAQVLKDQGREEGLAKGLAEGLAKGEAKGLAKAVLQLLAARRIRVDKASRQRIKNCLDVATLERWLARAMNATRISDVLDGPSQ